MSPSPKEIPSVIENFEECKTEPSNLKGKRNTTSSPSGICEIGVNLRLVVAWRLENTILCLDAVLPPRHLINSIKGVPNFTPPLI